MCWYQQEHAFDLCIYVFLLLCLSDEQEGKFCLVYFILLLCSFDKRASVILNISGS